MPLHILLPGRSPAFPDDPAALTPDRHGLVAIGGYLSPEIILESYRKGIFPWTGEHPIPWYSPDPRMILEPGEVRVTRSMRQVIRNRGFEVTYDTRFREVMAMCANIERPDQVGTWITPNMVRTWKRLHAMGYAHCVEVSLDGELVGGLYGIAIGRAFFGESMAARVPNASKVALITLCRALARLGFHFIDCQQSTSHLARMGAFDVTRKEFLERLAMAVEQPDAWLGRGAPPDDAPFFLPDDAT